MNKEELKEFNDIQISAFLTKEEILKAYRELQQENKELKRNCNIGNENLSFYRNENKELHNKIDKAIEYMKHYIKVEERKYNDNVMKEFEFVIKLLKGDVDEH